MTDPRITQLTLFLREEEIELARTLLYLYFMCPIAHHPNNTWID